MSITNLQFYQIAILVISLVMIYFGLEKFFQRQATQTFFKLIVRLIIWGGMSLVALFPDLTDTIAKFIGIEGNINAVILLGFLLVFLLIFKILSVVERLEQQISTIIRHDALKKFKDRYHQ
jgi:hypothetical protein